MENCRRRKQRRGSGLGRCQGVTGADSAEIEIRGRLRGQCWRMEKDTHSTHKAGPATSGLPRTWTRWPGWDPDCVVEFCLWMFFLLLLGISAEGHWKCKILTLMPVLTGLILSLTETFEPLFFNFLFYFTTATLFFTWHLISADSQILVLPHSSTLCRHLQGFILLHFFYYSLVSIMIPGQWLRLLSPFKAVVWK